MTDRRGRIIAQLDSNLEETITQFRSLSPEMLAIEVYQDGARWTVRQVLAHYITIEQSMHWLFNNILAGGPGSPKDFDFDRFNQIQPAKLDGCELEELIAQFKAVREKTIAIVREIAESDLDREGRHGFHGHGTLERFIVWAYEHVRLHAEDLRAVLASKIGHKQR